MIVSVLAVLALQASDLPSCSDLEYDGAHAACVLTTEAGATATFGFEPGEWGENGTVTVTGADGVVQLEESFETESFFYPSLQDLDGDGFEDILVPLITGNVNTDMLLIMGGEGGYAVASTGINGYAFDPVEPGLFVVEARSSAAEREAGFYTWNGETLDLEASVAIVFQDEDTATCTLVTGGEARGEDFYCAAVTGD